MPHVMGPRDLNAAFAARFNARDLEGLGVSTRPMPCISTR